MAAYIIVDVNIHDPRVYTEYLQLTPASVASGGGKFIVRGGATETLEGDWKPNRVVVLEFPDAATARAWWESPDYEPIKAIRQRSATTQMILVEGV